jgi:hypothetical protein
MERKQLSLERAMKPVTTKAWGLRNVNTGRIAKIAFDNRKDAEVNRLAPDEVVIRVIIKEYKIYA